MDREISTKSEISVEERNNGRGISRRDFLKGLAATGAGIAFFSATLKREAEAVDSYGHFAAGDLSDAQLIEMQRKMLQIRWYERTVADTALAGEKRIGGHLYAGEEACAVGVCTALRKDDWVQGYHRSHGHCIAKGANIKKMAAEIMFKATGSCGGYGGTMHIMQKDMGILGADGIVGPGAVLATGAAYGMKVRGTDQVAVCFGGDGHVNMPFFHMAMNEAANFKLPFVYVIENNGYQIWVPYTDTTNLKDLAVRAKGYEIPGYVVDGQDVMAVYAVTKRAVDRARAGDGPTLIECKTYRYYAHYGWSGSTEGEMGEFGKDYRSDREVRAWLQKDPVVIHRNRLIAWKVLSKSQADELEAEVKKEIAAAFKFAKESPVRRAEDGLLNVYAVGAVEPRQIAQAYY